MEDEELPTDYHTLYHELCSAWMLIEIKHRVSKEASSAFWEAAKTYFFDMYKARRAQGINKCIPKFRQIRNKLISENVPQIAMEFGYRNKDTGDITVVKNQQVTPKSRFPPSTFEQLYEIASIQVGLPKHRTI